MTMKKRIVIMMLALLAVAPTAWGQLYVDRTPKLKLGVTAGLNMTTMTVTRSAVRPYTKRTRAGFAVGPTLSLFSPVGGFGGDLSALLDYRSAASKSGGSEPVKSVSMQFPLNLSYSLKTSDVAMPFIFVGPQMGLNVGTVEHTMAFGIGSTTGHQMMRKWINEKKPVFSMNFGIGVRAMETVLVRLCYNMPLTKSGVFEQWDLETGESTRLGSGKIGAVQILISYLF